MSPEEELEIKVMRAMDDASDCYFTRDQARAAIRVVLEAAARVPVDLDFTPADNDPYWQGYRAGDAILRIAIRALAQETER